MTDEQNEPVMAGSNEAGDAEKVQGILAQVKADAPDATGPELTALLRQRFADAAIDIDDAELARISDSAGPSLSAPATPGE